MAVKVDTDKISRAHAVTPVIEAGKVFLPESASWLDYYLDTMAGGSISSAPWFLALYARVLLDSGNRVYKHLAVKIYTLSVNVTVAFQGLCSKLGRDAYAEKVPLPRI